MADRSPDRSLIALWNASSEAERRLYIRVMVRMFSDQIEEELRKVRPGGLPQLERCPHCGVTIRSMR